MNICYQLLNVKIKKYMKKIYYILIFCLIIISLLYAHYEYKNIKIKNIILKSKDIPKNFDWKKILFLADFQLDTEKKYNSKQMERIIKIVNQTEKDMILLWWDYTNWSWKIDRFFLDLKNIKIPELWGFAILWNHDYTDENKVIKNLKNIWYNVLNNENRKVNIWSENIFLAWVEDLWFWKPNADLALKWIKKEDFSILLNHNPDFFEEIKKEEKGKIDLTLSWHTHGWQVTFFWKIFYAPINNIKKYGYWFKEYDWSKIYITSWVWWTVFWMFIRFFAQPEIVVIKLEKIK